MQDKTWYSILGLDAEPLFLQDHMLNKNIRRVVDIFKSSCADNFCQAVHGLLIMEIISCGKIYGDDLISKGNNAKFAVNQIFGPSVYTGQDQIDGGDIFIDDTSTPIFNPNFEGMYVW